MELWDAILGRPALLIDVALVVVLGFIHVVAWLTLDTSRFERDPRGRSVDSIRTATTAGMTVAGILIPLALLAITLGTREEAAGFLRAEAAVDLFVAGGWLFLSLVCALLVIYLAAYEASEESIYRRKDIGILSGLQLIFLLTGVLRVMWGLASVATAVLE